MRSLLLTAMLSVGLLMASAQSYNVTFQVNMNLVGAAFTTPEVNGTFNGWCGGCNAMSDPDGDGIWATTISLAAGSYEFKYAYDSWAGQESLTPGDPCTVTAAGFTNRSLTVIDADIVMDPVCWGSCTACGVVGLTQMDLPVTFDDAGVDYGLIGFGGAEASSIVTDPTDPANTVAKVIKSATAELWAGTTITNPAGAGFANPIAFTAANTQMTVRVWSPDAGIPVRLKVEDHMDPTKSVETEAMTTVAGDWETLTFDFSNEAPGTAALNLAYNYDKASIFFNFGVTGAVAGEKTYYFDDVQFLGGAGLAQMDLPVTFDDTGVDYGLIGFGGAEASSIVVDPTDPANTVAKVIKSATAELWAGTTITNPAGAGFASPVPFTDVNTQMTVRVWSPDAGIPVRLKVEDHMDPTKSVETEAMTTVAGDWETLYFDFSNEAPGTAALNLAYTYDKASIFFNFGVTGAIAGEKTYYFDDVMFYPVIMADYNVTFNVNMNDVVAAFTTPEVNGTFNGWCGGCNPLSDPDGDGIWSATIPLPAGTYEFKYAYDAWAGSENLTDGDPCVINDGGFINRLLVVSGDVDLGPVCWGSCSDCVVVDTTYNVTFTVNMNEVTEPFTTPEVNGTFNGWCGGCAPMSDPDGDNIWELTIPLAAGDYEYKFAYDTWAGQENLTEGSPCTVTAFGFTNRALNVSSDVVLDTVCWGSCSNCGISDSIFNITFYVNMNDVTETFTTPEVNGTFNGWCGGCAPMSDMDGDGIWSLTIPLPAGTYEYKYAYDSWAGQESLTVGDPCTITTDGFTNRSLVVSGDESLDPVCWGSCSDCELGVNDFVNAAAVVISPNPASQYFTVAINAISNETLTLSVSDVFGNIVAANAQINTSSVRINTATLPAGMYFVQITNGKEVITKNLIVQH